MATWAKLFEPPALLAQLKRRPLLLAEGRGRPTRQQTMWNTLAWSEQLLAPEEQRLLQRLSVFVGGATLGAIAAVCGDGDDAALLVERVTTLLNHSLLRRVASSGLDGSASEPRLGMLEMIRQYAATKLSEQPERATLQRSHATYYRELAERMMAQWGVADTAAPIAQLKDELNNMRAALQWARDGGDVVVGLRLAGVLWRFWRSEGFIGEGRAWLEQLLERDTSTPNTVPTAGSARLLAAVAAAWLATDQHEYDHAEQLLAQSTAWRQAVGETADEARQLHTAALQARALETHLLQTAGLGARAVGDYRRATTLFEDALARGRALHTAGVGHALYDMGFSLYGLALLLREQGEYARAEALFEECVAFHRAAGDREGVAQGLLGLGDVARDQGDAQHLRSFTEASLTIYRQFGTQWAIGFALHNLAHAALLTGDLKGARELVDESAAMFRAQNAGRKPRGGARDRRAHRTCARGVGCGPRSLDGGAPTRARRRPAPAGSERTGRLGDCRHRAAGGAASGEAARGGGEVARAHGHTGAASRSSNPGRDAKKRPLDAWANRLRGRVGRGAGGGARFSSGEHRIAMNEVLVTAWLIVTQL